MTPPVTATLVVWLSQGFVGGPLLKQAAILTRFLTFYSQYVLLFPAVYKYVVFYANILHSPPRYGGRQYNLFSCQHIGCWGAQSVYICMLKLMDDLVGCTEHLTDMAAYV